MASEHIVKIIIKGLDKASKPLGDAGNALGGLGGIAAGVAKGGLALAAAAIVAVGAAAVTAVVGITNLALAAADVEATRGTYANLTEDLGGFEYAMEQAKLATRDMVSEQDLMAGSSKLLGMGIADTEEELYAHLEIATQLGTAYGSSETALDNWTLMMANQSILRLDSFGISSSAVRARMAELKEINEDMSKEDAWNIAVMEQAAVAMERVGEQGENATATTARWEASLADLKLNIGQAFIPALEAVRKPILELADEYGPKVIAWAEIAGEWLGEKMPMAIEWLKETWVKLQPAMEWVADMFAKYSEQYLPRLREAWDTLKGGIEPIVTIWNENLKPAFQELKEALGLGTVGTDDIAGAMGLLAGELLKFLTEGLVTGLTAGVQLLTIAFIKGKDAVEWIHRKMEGFERTMVSIRGHIQRVKEWIDWLRESIGRLPGLPAWLTPGSPTPFENALRGITDALSMMPDLTVALKVPTAIPAMAGAGVGGGGGASMYVIHNHFGRDSIRDDQDVLLVADAIREALEIRGTQPAL